MADVDTITVYIQDFLGGTVGNEYSNPRGREESPSKILDPAKNENRI